MAQWLKFLQRKPEDWSLDPRFQGKAGQARRPRCNPRSGEVGTWTLGESWLAKLTKMASFRVGERPCLQCKVDSNLGGCQHQSQASTFKLHGYTSTHTCSSTHSNMRTHINVHTCAHTYTHTHTHIGTKTKEKRLNNIKNEGAGRPTH